ncbi:GvpL/GvpF family gas vesicle protein [Kitasatospora sp. A2-31]|uniref:GvpL/GvpF family gas vesicle protein n=1 Tax=Kitasatospora sp. A2-31 TaxID=2916414 RepID=UPI001EEC1E27|nr:GvpL/GvpF family gas vesicle protein [Kitasatospora sp. A2-31]MCG6494200.1 GvpL/GvpF family gas vesicle protein [Kitasatospora sp. A2-31]
MNTTPSVRAGPVCYVYGVVPADAAEPTGATGVGDPPGRVTLVRHGRVAAPVSPVPEDRPLGTAADLRAHVALLNGFTAAGAGVLPLRFGTVADTAEQVVRALLRPQEPIFRRALSALDGRAQYTLRASYHEDRLLREIVGGREDIARLRAQSLAASEDPGHVQRVRLGELVADAVAARSGTDRDGLVDRLGPLATAVATAPDGSADPGFSASFLVHPDDWADFESTAEALARSWSDRVSLRLLGPLAPYEFAAALVAEAEGC